MPALLHRLQRRLGAWRRTTRLRHTADLMACDGRVHVGSLWRRPRNWLARSRALRRWVCAGLLVLRKVMAAWGALGLPLRLGVYRTLRSVSRFLQ